MRLILVEKEELCLLHRGPAGAAAYAGGEDAGAGDEESRLLRMFCAIRHACFSDIAFESMNRQHRVSGGTPGQLTEWSDWSHMGGEITSELR